MKKLKYFLLLAYFLTFTALFSQQFPKNAKTGECYYKCIDKKSKTGFTEWISIACNMKKDSLKLKSFILKIQYKLIDNGFSDIKPIGKLDYKTSYYYNNFRKLIRKRKREEKRRRKKAKK